MNCRNCAPCGCFPPHRQPCRAFPICSPCCCAPCPCRPPCPPTPTPEYFSIAYNPNGGTGGQVDAGIAAGTPYTIRDAQGATVGRPGYEFVGWNTHPDGSGDIYSPGEVITVCQNLTLYAQWTPERIVTLIYEPNLAGSGGLSVTAPAGTPVTVSDTSIVSNGGRQFLEWNTDPDGGGTRYLPGDMFTLTVDTTLYARWKSMPPLVNVVYEFDIQISGAGTYHLGYGGSLITVYFPNGATVTTVVAANGTWTVTVPITAQPLLPGMLLLMRQTELNMETSDLIFTYVLAMPGRNQ